MNPFDESMLELDDESLSGIGSSLRKIGRKIDSARRKVEKVIIPKPLLKLRKKITKELKRFLASDLGKIVAVVVIVVATVYGLGPVVMEGLKAVVQAAGAYVKAAAKAAAKYVAKNMTKAGLKKAVIKKVKSEAVKAVVKKGAQKYGERKIKKAQKKHAAEMKKIEAENQALEDKVYRDMEAQFLKDSGYTLEEVEAAQLEANQPRPFVYNVPQPKKPGPTSSASDWEKWGRSGGQAAYDKWKKGRDAAYKNYLAQKPAQSDSTMNQMISGMNSMINNMAKVERSPAYTNTVKNLSAQGIPKREIKKKWLQSDTFRQVTTASAVKAFAPMMAQSYMARGVDKETARNMAISETAKMGERAVLAKQSANPLTIMALIGAALIAV